MPEIHIKVHNVDSQYPPLDPPKKRREKKLQVSLLDCLLLKVAVEFETNDAGLRIISIQVPESDKIPESEAQVNITTNHTIYDEKPASRIVLNLSYNNGLKNEVGSCVLKLTQQGIIVLHTKTDNIIIFKLDGQT